MPGNCNGLDRHDKTKEFNKYNCFWAYKKKGCKRKTGELKPKKIPPGSKIKQPVSICLTIEKDHLEFIKKQAMHRSLELGHLVEANDMIRDALKDQFPMSRQMDLMGSRYG